MFDWLLSALFIGADLALISPEAMVGSILLLDELVIIKIGGKERFLLGGIASFCNLSEGSSEFILAIFTWNVSTVSRNLCSRVYLAHQNIITSTM